MASFNGLMVNRTTEGVFSTTQGEKIDWLILPKTQDDFHSHRDLAQYVEVNIRPEVCAAVQVIALRNKPTDKEGYKSLEKGVKFLKQTVTQCLNFVKLKLNTT